MNGARNGASLGRNNYGGQVTSDRHHTTAQKLKIPIKLNIGTWNVRTMYMAGQFDKHQVGNGPTRNETFGYL